MIKENQFPENGTVQQKIKFILNYAILAPSAFNSQPWKFEIIGQKLKIIPDFSKQRTGIDPENRELYISIGAVVTNIKMAAFYFGMIYKQTDNLSFEFVNGKRLKGNKKIIEALVNRQTNRGEYKEKRIDKISLSKIEKISDVGGAKMKLFDDGPTKNLIADLVTKSNMVWYKSKELVDELEVWLKNDIEKSEDGIPSGAWNINRAATNLWYFLSHNPNEVEAKVIKDGKLAKSAPVIGVVLSDKDNQDAWIKAGMALEMAAIKMAEMGISNAYFNTIVELPTQREKLKNILGTKNFPQLVLRLGYAIEHERKSPRIGLDKVLTIKLA